MKGLKTLFLVLVLATFGFGDAYLIARETSKEIPSEGVKITRTCHTCRGERRVEERQPCENCQSQGCGVCDWKGYRIVKVTCPTCDGTGKEVIRQG